MMHTIFEVELPVQEVLRIRKNTIGEEFAGKSPRLSIVTGVHGDELEGQYICYELARRVNEHIECLKGVLDIYPGVNPLGIDITTRLVPKWDVDLNRSFPGDKEGHMVERMAAAIVEDLIGSDMIIDIHASDMFVRELPQVRIAKEFSEKLLPFAKQMNVDMIWMNEADVAHEATLAHTMNMFNVPTLVVEMGLGTRINVEYGNQVVDGILNLMSQMGIWQGVVAKTKLPVVSSDGEVVFIRSSRKGIFIPRIEHNHYIQQGEVLGIIVNPYTGETIEEVASPDEGLVFTLRVNPLVYEGSLIARLLAHRIDGIGL
ncbi:MAG: M14 family metallopeptidase [Lachnospiraceae bacterium]